MSICLIFPSLNYFFATLNTEACQAWNSLFNSFLLGFNNNCQFLQPKFICLVIKRSKSKTKTYKLTICIFLEMCEWQFNETTESMRKTRSGHMFQRVINFVSWEMSPPQMCWNIKMRNFNFFQSTYILVNINLACHVCVLVC